MAEEIDRPPLRVLVIEDVDADAFLTARYLMAAPPISTRWTARRTPRSLGPGSTQGDLMVAAEDGTEALAGPDSA